MDIPRKGETQLDPKASTDTFVDVSENQSSISDSWVHKNIVTVTRGGGGESPTLSGRKEEIALLERCFYDSRNSKQLVLIAGNSGMGKSALARHLDRNSEALTALGKHKMDKEEESFSPMAQACTQLCNKLEKFSNLEAIVGELRSELQHGDTRVLFRLVPAIRRLVDPNPSHDQEQKSPPSSIEDDVKMKMAIRRFFGVLSRHIQLVLTIDDMQWADQAFVKLVEFIFRDRMTSSLMIIFCFRDKEVTNEHPMMRMIPNISSVTRIDLQPLDAEAVLDMITSILEKELDGDKNRLARLVLSQTTGNPLHVRQFVSWMLEEGLLKYSEKWTWDLQKLEILVASVSSDFGDFIKSKLLKLPLDGLNLLKLAALLGTHVSSDVFSLVADHYYSHEEGQKGDPFFGCTISYTTRRFTTKSISSLGEKLGVLRAGKDSDSFTWLHDKIQEAVTNLVPSDQRTKIAFQVGTLLIEGMSDETLEDNVFLVTKLLNRGMKFIPASNSGERKELAELNLLVGRKSIETSAFQQAAWYFEQGISVLPADSWESCFDLTLSLFSYGGEVMYYTGQFQKCDKYCQSIIRRHDMPLTAKRRAYQAHIRASAADGKVDSVINTCIELLGLLGCHIPLYFRLCRMLPGLFKAKSRVNFFLNNDDVSRMHRIDDEKQEWIMSVLGDLCHAGYLGDRADALVSGIVRSFQWSTKFGVCEETPIAIARLGFVLMVALNEYEQAEQCGEIALELLTIVSAERVVADTHLSVHGFLNPWRKPVDFEALELGWKAATAIGHMEMTFYIQSLAHEFRLLLGYNLVTIQKDLETFVAQAVEHKQRSAEAWGYMYQQTVANLVGEISTPQELNGQYLHMDSFMKRVKAGYFGKPVFMEACVRRFAIMVAFFFDDYDLVFQIRSAMDEEQMLKITPGVLPVTQLFAVVALAAVSQSREKRGRFYKRIAFRGHKRLRKWVEAGNPNIVEYESLVAAELRDLHGDSEGALSYYRAAVDAAASRGTFNSHAIVEQRFAEFYMRRDCLNEARRHLQLSQHLFSKWGAQGKVDHLSQRYCELLEAKQPGGLRNESTLYSSLENSCDIARNL